MSDLPSETDLLFELVVRKLGRSLREQDLERLRERVEQVVRIGEELRSAPLDNADEPFSVFTPYIAPAGKP